MAVITGTNADDKIHGTGASDILNGLKGADQMIGGFGDDTYIVDNLKDVVIEYANQGHDLVQSSVSYTLAANVEDLKLVGTAAIDATGNELDNVIIGNDGNNTIDGGAGADTMAGGNGSDLYHVDNAGDQVVEGLNVPGWDSVWSTISVAKLWDNVEGLALLGSADLNATGNDLNNAIAGNSGSNIINGGRGADTMGGGAGDDTYIVDNAHDVVIEKAGEGTDSVRSAVSHLLEENVENLTLIGHDNISALGNALDNVLIGNDGNNTLSGGAGNDTMTGGKGDDSYVVDSLGDQVIESPGGGVDTIYTNIDYSLAGLTDVENLHLTGNVGHHGIGNAFDNVIVGSNGDDNIDGGAGADIMSGGLGSDRYFVDNVGDVVNETGSYDIDEIDSTIAFDHAVANVESYVFNITTGLHFTGSSVGNAITGGSADDTIDGGAGNDFLVGREGNDTLIGGAGDDHLLGGEGVDHMTGGSGNDTYFLDNVDDVVVEGINGGEDSVAATFTLTNLFANVEEGYLAGDGNIDLTGNKLDNVLYGNHGNNTVDGGLGNDEINGQDGNDTLIGGKGADTFDFDMSPLYLQNDGQDTIKDFVKAEDVLSFDHIQDHNGDHKITMDDLLASVSSVVDHGSGQSVDVTFENGGSITFAGAGTGAVQHITDLVAHVDTQIHVS